MPALTKHSDTEIGRIVASIQNVDPTKWDGCKWVIFITSAAVRRFAWDGYTTLKQACESLDALMSDEQYLVGWVKAIAEDQRAGLA